MPDLRDVTPMLEPRPEVVRALERLLEDAKTGKLRGFLFVALRQGGDYSYGAEGVWDLAVYAMSIKLMELELDSLVTHNHEVDE